MKPDWEKLGAEYQDHPSVVIGDVDCTEHQGTCSDNGVSGYPTIKYFLSGEPEAKKYQQGRTYDDLKKFVVDELEKMCTLDETESCSEKEIKFMELAKGKESEWVGKQLARLTKMKDSKMAPNLKIWVVQRLNILKQIVATSGPSKDEL